MAFRHLGLVEHFGVSSEEKEGMTTFPEGLMSPEGEALEGGLVGDKRSRFADLKGMLEGNKDGVKVDAMKRIINLVARGKDMSELFPSVVKNVAAKNVELKKLVYVYLERYAEEQQDLALLSISTFQRGLKDPNQLIRASALRVLSSIRVAMISPIILLAIKDGVRDMSPYVRKVAAHAIPKLYSVDRSVEDDVIECIVLLLSDRRGLVLGSAVYALDQVCPHRLDLLHLHFRAFCKALPDIDEWGQVVMLNLLTRYARTQLSSPDILPIDDDLSLLVHSARPLLQSRNPAVVLAVTALMSSVAPPSSLPQCALPLVRLLRHPREVQHVVLLNMATLCERQRTMFDPFLKSFFLRSSDSSHIRQLKLHILTALVNETNVHVILRELRTYVSSSSLAGEAIEAIGRCAVRVGSVSDSCLGGLVQLLSSSEEDVVSSCVMVLKRLLHSDAPVPLLLKLCRLLPSLKAPQARACVVWLVCTHIHKVINIAPDLLRILAKSFANEHESVKMETLKLAVALWIVKREQSTALAQYVFHLARFDLSYDIRDRCRFLRQLIFKTDKLSAHCADIFMAHKPAPSLSCTFAERHELQLGTLSHVLNQNCSRYEPLPPWTEKPSPAYVRGVIEVEKEESEEEDEDEEESEEGDDESEDGEEEESEEESDEDEEESDEEEEGSEDSEEEEKVQVNRNSKKNMDTRRNGAPQPPSKPSASTAPLDLLLDIDFSPAGNRSIVSSSTVSSNSLEVVSSLTGLSVFLSFPRTPHPSGTPLTFTIYNTTNNTCKNIRLVPPQGVVVTGKTTVDELEGKKGTTVNVVVETGDTGGSKEWKVEEEGRNPRRMEVNIPLGEQLEGVRMSEEEAEKERSALTGMNRVEKTTKRTLTLDDVMAIANVYPSTNKILTAQTRSRKEIVVIELSPESFFVSSPNALLAASLAFAIHSHISS